MKAKIPEWIREKKSKQNKCTGCGKDISGITSTRYFLAVGAYVKGTPDEMRFCKTCMDHIRRGGPIFFSTYSFKKH